MITPQVEFHYRRPDHPRVLGLQLQSRRDALRDVAEDFEYFGAEGDISIAKRGFYVGADVSRREDESDVLGIPDAGESSCSVAATAIKNITRTATVRASS